MITLERPLKRLQKNSWVWSEHKQEEKQMSQHVPVMLNEVLSYLKLSPGKVIVDCTLGEAGHSEGILRKITPGGQLIGIDQDDDALSLSRRRLSCFDGSFTLLNKNFQGIKDVIQNLGLNAMDGVLFDLGVSNLQFTDPERGFSFQFDGPLNMRMDKKAQITAFDLINNLSEEELANLIFKFGEERLSRRIAHRIISHRNKKVINTTQELAEIVVEAFPIKQRYKKIHPATRTFMALRIAVNRELEVLQSALTDAIDLLSPGGRICVISFHSLEDRIVKHEFRSQAKNGVLKIITKRPLVASEQELAENRKSRSAKLRVAEKI